MGLDVGLKEGKVWKAEGMVIVGGGYRAADDEDPAEAGEVINIGGFSDTSHSSGGNAGTV